MGLEAATTAAQEIIIVFHCCCKRIVARSKQIRVIAEQGTFTVYEAVAAIPEVDVALSASLTCAMLKARFEVTIAGCSLPASKPSNEGNRSAIMAVRLCGGRW